MFSFLKNYNYKIIFASIYSLHAKIYVLKCSLEYVFNEMGITFFKNSWL
jgi:hypothetical protein